MTISVSANIHIHDLEHVQTRHFPNEDGLKESFNINFGATTIYLRNPEQAAEFAKLILAGVIHAKEQEVLRNAEVREDSEA